MSSWKTSLHQQSLTDSLKQRAQPQLDWLGIVLIILSAAGFATLGIFGKLAYSQGFSLIGSLLWRVGGAAAALWLWLLLCNQWRIRRRAAATAFWLGALLYTLQAALFFGALVYSSAGLTTLMFFTYPAFVAIIRWIFLRQPVYFWHVIALSLAIAGCIANIDWRHEMIHPLGIGLGIASGASYGLYLVFSARLVQTASPIKTAAYMLFGATTTALGLAISQHQLILPQTLSQLGPLAGLAILSTALPIVFLFIGLQRLDVISASILSTLEPILAVVMGIALLGESLWVGQIIGGVMILASSVLLQIKQPGS